MMDPFLCNRSVEEDNAEELTVLVWPSECAAFTADNASEKVCGLVVGLEGAQGDSNVGQNGMSSNNIGGVNPDN